MSTDMRRILVTGANKGIGRATVAAVLSAHKDAFVFLGSRDSARGEEARAALTSRHPGWADRIAVVPLDVSDDASANAAAQQVKTSCGPGQRLYGIVNNAGVGFSADSMAIILNVNTCGPKRVCDAFFPLLEPGGRVVNVSSASGPRFVSACGPERQRIFTDEAVTWDQIEAIMKECLKLESEGGDFEAAGFGASNAYGLSKACLNAYTIALARAHPGLTINACTPGFIETDMTRRIADGRGSTPSQMGMKSPAEGTRATMHLLFGDVGGSGWYFGSDAQRSPLDAYRAPGDPPYKGR